MQSVSQFWKWNLMIQMVFKTISIFFCYTLVKIENIIWLSLLAWGSVNTVFANFKELKNISTIIPFSEYQNCSTDSVINLCLSLSSFTKFLSSCFRVSDLRFNFLHKISKSIGFLNLMPFLASGNLNLKKDDVHSTSFLESFIIFHYR